MTYHEPAVEHLSEHRRLLVQQHAMDLEVFTAADESEVGVERVVEEAMIVSTD